MARRKGTTVNNKIEVPKKTVKVAAKGEELKSQVTVAGKGLQEDDEDFWNNLNELYGVGEETKKKHDSDNAKHRKTMKHNPKSRQVTFNVDSLDDDNIGKS